MEQTGPSSRDLETLGKARPDAHAREEPWRATPLRAGGLGPVWAGDGGRACGHARGRRPGLPPKAGPRPPSLVHLPAISSHTGCYRHPQTCRFLPSCRPRSALGPTWPVHTHSCPHRDVPPRRPPTCPASLLLLCPPSSQVSQDPPEAPSPRQSAAPVVTHDVTGPCHLHGRWRAPIWAPVGHPGLAPFTGCGAAGSEERRGAE